MLVILILPKDLPFMVSEIFLLSLSRYIETQHGKTLKKNRQISTY